MGGVITGSSTSVTGIVTGASVVGGVMTGTSLSATGNITGGNVLGTTGVYKGGVIVLNANDTIDGGTY